MQIHGEAYLFMNGMMNYLSLLMAFRLARVHFPGLRGLLAALLGAGYAFLAALGGALLRGPGAIAGAALVMSMMAGGRRGVRLWPMVLAGGWMISGMVDFLLARGLSASFALCGAGMGALLLCWGLDRLTPRPGQTYRLMIHWQGKRAILPAIRDSGNLLRDGVTGLPVIVAPLSLARQWIPGGGEKLPVGCRLLPMQTAGGRKLALCLHPERIVMIQGRRKWQVDAIVALGDFEGPGALLPGALFMQKEEGFHAGL